ncbi:hypothetical protein QBC36DRAFT_307857 [Triangularia setosa]|uniref:Uncharacterized protein n=1 Tax=Triangularia setosa TaxID=2587417 RepID=A0AAN6WDF6_9PEZI|nr:hypothetical protein QBC36DRAFT_307857 [Podospora setosa]
MVEPNNGSYPCLPSYWLDAVVYKTNNTSPATSPAIADTASLPRFLDPFQPVHGYSSFLPIRELKLLDWTWQQALNHMTAFFHMGPLVVAKDVPDFDPSCELRADYSLSGKPMVYDKQTVDVLPTSGEDGHSAEI